MKRWNKDSYIEIEKYRNCEESAIILRKAHFDKVENLIRRIDEYFIFENFEG